MKTITFPASASEFANWPHSPTVPYGKLWVDTSDPEYEKVKVWNGSTWMTVANRKPNEASFEGAVLKHEPSGDVGRLSEIQIEA